MSDNKFGSEKNKNFPTSFLLFLVAVLLVVVTLQNLMTTKQAQVSFSYQLEHLVNLQLIVPQESKKIALNDNLVNFTGKFKDKESEESKKRFRYLELLQQRNELGEEAVDIETSLADLKKKVETAALHFLRLLGDKSFNSYSVFKAQDSLQEYSITINPVPTEGWNLVSLRQALALYAQDKSNAQKVEQQMNYIVEELRSSTLGIGSEEIKQTLKSIDTQLKTASNFTLFNQLFAQIETIVEELNRVTGNHRLDQLRSVREYLQEIMRYENLNKAISLNQAQLEQAKENVAHVIWFFNNRELSTRALEKQDVEMYSNWFANAQQEWNGFKHNKGLSFRAPDQPRNLVLEKMFKSEETSPNYFSYFLTLLPIILVLGLLYFVFSRQLKGMGGNAMQFGKSPARLLTKGQNKVTFKDVAGIDEAKEELVEIVDFLKDPSKFTALGGRIPKGVLCIGPPGTGKTLIAKAVAGEADRPFFSLAGSDFVEMFVGVGASRIRDMFAQAKKQAPCIIFIDEIDAVGRHRGAGGIGGGHDEREQTLNQLLVEMDGFDTNEGVILMAATNRPDVLDKALLRPGRFDRRVMIGLPDIKGRYDILKVHARKIKIDPSVDLMAIARSTPGASGADLENLLNEAALLAARKGKAFVTQSDTAEARDKILFGKERRSLEVDEGEKRTTAYHESGHAIVSLCVKHSDPVEKVTIIPRGFSLGATHFLPKKNRLSYWKKELLDELAICMGGRAAEELFLGDISSGAQQDFNQATKLARNMVCSWGMSEKLGLVSYDSRLDYNDPYAASEKSYSPQTAQAIDEEIHRILQEAYDQAIEMIQTNKDKVELMTNMLIEFETLDADDVQHIFKGTWDTDKKRAKLQKMLDQAKVQPTPPPLPKELGKSDTLGLIQS